MPAAAIHAATSIYRTAPSMKSACPRGAERRNRHAPHRKKPPPETLPSSLITTYRTLPRSLYFLRAPRSRLPGIPAESARPPIGRARPASLRRAGPDALRAGSARRSISSPTPITPSIFPPEPGAATKRSSPRCWSGLRRGLRPSPESQVDRIAFRAYESSKSSRLEAHDRPARGGMATLNP
jgi:hypothetical protein